MSSIINNWSITKNHFGKLFLNGTITYNNPGDGTKLVELISSPLVYWSHNVFAVNISNQIQHFYQGTSANDPYPHHPA